MEDGEGFRSGRGWKRGGELGAEDEGEGEEGKEREWEGWARKGGEGSG